MYITKLNLDFLLFNNKLICHWINARVKYKYSLNLNSCLRYQMNQITHWLDSSNVYGSDLSDARKLRSFETGNLRSSRATNDDELLPDHPEEICRGSSRKCFIAGNKKDRRRKLP